MPRRSLVRRTRRMALLGILASFVVIAAIACGLGLSACSQTPTSVPVRTFERAQRMDIACLQLFDPQDGFRPIEPVGRTREECVPTPSNSDGNFVNQLFALVTQSTRGEIAVVDLSVGFLIDQSRGTPGVNFIPVGALPTDVTTTPDGKMVFVASAEPNKAAIYGIPTRRILGDQPNFPHDPEPPTIASWPVCALPQNPGAITVVPRRGAPLPAAPSADAGDAGDAGAAADGGAADLPDYELVVVLPGDRRSSAKIVTIDPRPFRRGSLRRLPDGTPDYASDRFRQEPVTLGPGPVLEPGSLAPCPITAALELSGEVAVPTSFKTGPAWDDGVKYVDGGVDLTCQRPTRAGRCGLRPCCNEPAPPPAPPPSSDAGADAEAGAFIQVDAGACETVTGGGDAGTTPFQLGPLDPPRLVSIVRDDQTLYVADEGVPLIHVIDISTPGAPRELPPLIASSSLDPSRAVQVRELAISPATRDYKRYLYAVDRIEGSIMVFDVTDPASKQRTPLTRPHPELNPFQPVDRIAFSSPVVAVAFARHDVPLGLKNGVRVPTSASGVLCNPNQNLDSNPELDQGFYYRANSTDPGQNIGPRRLRGVFAFATLANGQVLTIDVDDWDSPCRRPRDLSADTTTAGGISNPTRTNDSDIAPPQPLPSGPTDIDPYHAPKRVVTQSEPDLTVTNEVFFPMSSPHTLRSEILVRSDDSSGPQQPRVQGAATITASGVVLPQNGPESLNTPLLSTHFALEDPRAHIDQDWTVTYEGAIPGFDGVSATIDTEDNFRSLSLKQPQARFCSKGVEDWALGIERTNAIALALQRKGQGLLLGSERLMSDYVQLTEEILPVEDPYWGLSQECWDPSLDSPGKRQDACARTFGTASEENTQRDFPIIEAFDDHVVLGRFYSTPPTPTSPARREVVYKDPGEANAKILKLMQCCFHRQVRFKVRTGQLWSAVGKSVGGGAGVGFFSHLTTEGGRCVPSCEPRESLLNGRLPTLPSVSFNPDPKERANDAIKGVGRNSALGMRNPMFDMRIVSGALNQLPTRDTAYTFSTRGQFRALFVSIGGSSISVNPQSMRFIEPLNQIAVVDGASQGLVLIDLRAVTVARAPYF